MPASVTSLPVNGCSFQHPIKMQLPEIGAKHRSPLLPAGGSCRLGFKSRGELQKHRDPQIGSSSSSSQCSVRAGRKVFPDVEQAPLSWQTSVVIVRPHREEVTIVPACCIDNATLREDGLRLMTLEVMSRGSFDLCEFHRC